MAPGILEALTQPDFCSPVKLRPEAPTKLEESHANHSVFYELDKRLVGFFMFAVVHRGMARGLSMILSHCATIVASSVSL